MQIVDPADLPRLAELDLTASVQPIHVTDDMDTADLLLGARGAQIYNFRTLLDTGTRLALGSDAPVADPSPFLGMHAAITRQRPDNMQRAALVCSRTHYAWPKSSTATRWTRPRPRAGPTVIGSISVGKRADLIMLDRDLFALEAAGITGDEIAQTQVLMTVFDGAMVYAA